MTNQWKVSILHNDKSVKVYYIMTNQWKVSILHKDKSVESPVYYIAVVN